MNQENKLVVAYPLMNKDVAAIHVHISGGNSKIGHIYNVSTLPGDKQHKPATKALGTLTDVDGTCIGVCDECSQYCYAFDSAVQYHTSCIPSWGENTRLIREDPDRFFKEVSEYFDHHTIEEFRINVSGELECYDWLEKWTALAEKHPDVRFGIYTKKFDFITLYLKKHEKFPDNFYLNASEWHGNLDKLYGQLDGKVNFFAYTESLVEAAEYAKRGYKVCQAINHKGQHTGKRCDECGYCYGRKGIIKVCVLDHSTAGRGRLSKEIRQLIKDGKLKETLVTIFGEEEAARLLGEQK